MPPAALVASMTVRAPSSPWTRCTGAVTPVEVSLCGHAYTSTPSTGSAAVRVPAAASRTSGASSHGAFAAPANFAAELAEHEVLRSGVSMSPKAAASQNAVDPPLPTMIS